MKPSDSAVHVEAVKISLRQSKDGVVLGLSLHPQDMPPSVLTDPVGTRYMIALVRLGDDDQPETPEDKTQGQRAVVSAGLLAKLPEFWKWLYHNGLQEQKPPHRWIVSPSERMNGIPNHITEEFAAEAIRLYCGVSSRSELAYDHEARKKFFSLRATFEEESKMA